MELHGSTLVIVADGARARLFKEKVRGGLLSELPKAALGDIHDTGPRASRHSGRVQDRFGPSSHTTGGPSPKVREEADFVRRLAAQAEEIFNQGGYEGIILIAAPRALGGLRVALSPAALRRVTGSEAADRVSQSLDELRTALSHIRRKQA